MQDKIPIPTDNIYKFYALFGLLLFIFSFSALIYVNRSTNDLAFQSKIELETINQITNASPVDLAKKQVLEKRVEIAVHDRDFYVHGTGALSGIGMLLMVVGFWQWHRVVQPIQDEIASLQLEKLRHEVKHLKNSPPMADQPSTASVDKKQKHR